MIGSLVVGEDVINLCTQKGYYVVAYRQWEYLDILNAKQMPFPPSQELEIRKEEDNPQGTE